MFGLAVLLAAASAVADTVVTAKEVISCRVVSASADSVRLTLAQGRGRTLRTWDVYEVRLSDSARVAELAVLLPRANVILDSGQSVPPPELRTREAMRLRLDRTRAKGLPGHADVVDTLARRATPDEMAARCRDMEAVLSQWGQSDETVAELLSEVRREVAALRGTEHLVKTYLASGTCGGVLGGLIGGVSGCAFDPPVLDPDATDRNCGGGPVGAAVGCVAGPVIGVGIGVAIVTSQRAVLIARHRNRVNYLIRRVNRAVASPP